VTTPTDTGELWLEDSGGDGTPIVLLHPGITDSTIWDRLVPLLDGHRIIRFDRPGYGRSPRPTAASRPVDQLRSVLDTLDVERAHLVGNSMGGGTALALAVSDPARVASVVGLCSGCAGFPWPPEAEDPEVDAEFERLEAAKDIDGLTDLYLRVFAASGEDDYLRAQVRDTTEFELSGADLAGADPETWEGLATLAIPVTMVAGNRDEKASTIAAVGVSERVPGAELVRLDTDHLPQYRDPQAVADIVLRTVARAS
jgi:pimeloyl-ACP methyl ester carboxylesterase